MSKHQLHELERVRHIAERYAPVDPETYGVNQVVIELSRAIINALAKEPRH